MDPHPHNSGHSHDELAAINSRLDDLRAAQYSLSDKLSQSLSRLEASLSELSSASAEMKLFNSAPHKESIVREVSESVGNIFARHPRADEVAVLFGKQVSKELDAKLSTLAELQVHLLAKSDAAVKAAEEARKQVSLLAEQLSQSSRESDGRLVALSDGVAELKATVASTKQESASATTRFSSLTGEIKGAVAEAVGEIRGSVGEALDSKLAKLAELEAELYKKELENAQTLAEIKENMAKLELSANREELMVNALGNMSGEIKSLESTLRQQVAAKQEESYAAIRATLLKVVENQNRLNEVLADSLTSLLDSTEANKNTIAEVKLHVTEMKSKLDLEKTGELEKRVAESLAKKLTGG